MTEADWLAATDPAPMLTFLRDRGSERKLRLFACHSCYRVWALLTDERSRLAVEVTERFAEGRATAEEMDAAEVDANDVWNDSAYEDDGGNPDAADAACCAASFPTSAFTAARTASHCAAEALHEDRERAAEASAQSELLRDIFGNPFRPVGLDPAWRTEAVVALAAGIYADRAFERLPVLADALDDVGCADADILSHCRADGPHVRGCWVVDLLLGKT